MSRKRQNTSSPEPDFDSPSPKRQRSSPFDGDHFEHPPRSRSRDETVKVSTVYGQLGAFPGLNDSDELFYGPANDGIEYLRMVRSEAKGVPLLLYASRETRQNELEQNDEDELDESGGYFEDGAFIAAPVRNTSTNSGLSEVQELYYLALLRRYKQLRASLGVIPPLSAIELLKSSQPISFPAESRNARIQWRDILRRKQPHPTQVACMDADSVLTMIGLLADASTEIFRGGKSKNISLFGAWAWALLGKSKDVTELGSEEISEIRRLGRKAADVMEFLRETPERSQNGSDTEQNQTLEDMKLKLTGMIGREAERVEEAQEAARDVAETVETQPAIIILNMIITIVGEIYGQRDLLKFRRIWKAA